MWFSVYGMYHLYLSCVQHQIIESPHVEDLANMPDDVISELKHVLKKESSGYGDNACKAFLLAMVSMIGGYSKALKFREVSKVGCVQCVHISSHFNSSLHREKQKLYLMKKRK